MKRLPTLLALVAASICLSACRPLYVPLVPNDAPEPITRTRLSADSELNTVGGRPSLVLIVLDPAPEFAQGDWLAVQWFAPSGRIAASDSRWVESDDVGAELTFDLPPDVALVPGEWRAVASVGSLILRQFRVDVSVDPDS